MRLVIFSFLGYRNCVCNVDEGDLLFCLPYTKTKPPCVCPEFTALAELLIRENQWNVPHDCEAALALYLNLINNIPEDA